MKPPRIALSLVLWTLAAALWAVGLVERRSPAADDLVPGPSYGIDPPFCSCLAGQESSDRTATGAATNAVAVAEETGLQTNRGATGIVTGSLAGLAGDVRHSSGLEQALALNAHSDGLPDTTRDVWHVNEAGTPPGLSPGAVLEDRRPSGQAVGTLQQGMRPAVRRWAQTLLPRQAAYVAGRATAGYRAIVEHTSQTVRALVQVLSSPAASGRTTLAQPSDVQESRDAEASAEPEAYLYLGL